MKAILRSLKERFANDVGQARLVLKFLDQLTDFCVRGVQLIVVNVYTQFDHRFPRAIKNTKGDRDRPFPA